MATLIKRGLKRTWYVRYFDHTGKRRSTSTKTTTYEAAKRIADKLEAEAAIRRERVIDPREESIAQQARRPLAEHIADYRAKLKAAGRDDHYISHTVTSLRGRGVLPVQHGGGPQR